MELVQEPGSKRVSALLRPRCGLLGRHPKRAALSGGRDAMLEAAIGLHSPISRSARRLRATRVSELLSISFRA